MASRQTRTGPSRRTQAERDAINARAAAWLRPRQVEALAALAKACSRKTARGFHRSVAGWHGLGYGGHGFATATVDSLVRRGLACFGPHRRGHPPYLFITPAGRRELRNYR